MSGCSFFSHPERSEGPHLIRWRIRASLAAAEDEREMRRRPAAAQNDALAGAHSLPVDHIDRRIR
jgi:hypothetical protein